MQHHAVVPPFSDMPPGCDGRAYDDSAYMRLCRTGQVRNLVRLMEVEGRYGLRGADCVVYRRALDAAAAAGGGGVDRAAAGMPPSNADWRYRVARWMLRVSAGENRTPGRIRGGKFSETLIPPRHPPGGRSLFDVPGHRDHRPVVLRSIPPPEEGCREAPLPGGVDHVPLRGI